MPDLKLVWKQNGEGIQQYYAMLPGFGYKTTSPEGVRQFPLQIWLHRNGNWEIAFLGRALKHQPNSLFKAQMYAEDYARAVARSWLRALEPLHLDEPPWEPPKSQPMQESVDEM